MVPLGTMKLRLNSPETKPPQPASSCSTPPVGQMSKAPYPGHGVARLSDQIPRLMKNLGLSDDFHGWRVAQAWPEIVGTSLAPHAKAIRYCDHTLFVRAPDPTWRQSLAQESEILLQKIHSYPGGEVVTRIEFLAA